VHDSLLKVAAPLLISMKIFGIYFDAKEKTSPLDEPTQEVSEEVDVNSKKQQERHLRWTAGRVYATVVLVGVWLHFVQLLTQFNSKDTFGAALFSKISLALLS